MLTIRFSRIGKRNKAQFKIMLQEHTSAPGGKHVEVLGSYDPHRKIAVLKEEKIKYWLSKGARVSDTVHNLLVSKGIILEKKRPVKIPKKEADKIEEKAASSAAPADEAGKPEIIEAKEEKKENKKEEAKTE